MLVEESTQSMSRQSASAPVSGVKSILLHVQNDKSLDGRLESALSLARACSAHLTCLHVTPIDAYVAFDSFGGVFVMNDVIKALDEEEARLRSSVESKLRSEDVQWDYVQVTGNVANRLAAHAALADLIVVGRDPHPANISGPAIGLIGDLLNASRTPLFLHGDESGPCDPAGTALIAWNGSYEAANAVRSSIGLLGLASDVRILAIDEQASPAFPDTRLLEYLSRHGIEAELTQESVPSAGGDPRFVAGLLIEHARSIAAAYVVMGGYSHGRITEYIFGGVTRSLLTACPVPLVIAR